MLEIFHEVFWGSTVRELLTFLKEKDIPVHATIEGGSSGAGPLFIDWEEEV